MASAEGGTNAVWALLQTEGPAVLSLTRSDLELKDSEGVAFAARVSVGRHSTAAWGDEAESVSLQQRGS